MWRARTIALVVVVATSGVLIGCDRRSEAQSVTTVSTKADTRNVPAAPTKTRSTAPTSRPSTSAAATRREPATLTIDSKIVTFPPARIQVIKKGAGLTLVLFSDDPPAGPDQDRANSFYFQMPLTIDDVDEISIAKWHFKLDKDFPDDLPDGIFLDGGATQIQPVDVEAKFAREGEEVVVTLHGQFADFGNVTDGKSPPRIEVSAKASAIPE